jgi:hypothetical protein
MQGESAAPPPPHNSFPRPARHASKTLCAYFVGRQLKPTFSSPHFGAGAGISIEDSAVMAELLAEVQRRLQSTTPGGGGLTAADALEAAFQSFNACRREHPVVGAKQSSMR